MGPLNGFTIIEMAGIGPCPMAGMLLADMGAKVIRIEKNKQRPARYATDISGRNKLSMVVDLKQPAGQTVLSDLINEADALIEGFRPGVMEKLNLGPDRCLAINPALVFGRMTGWGQEGPLAQTAGHDINYIALTGALHAIGRANEKPVPPLNLVGDFGGGAMFLVCGVLAALLEARKSGRGQVVDSAMVDGSANLMWMCHSFNTNKHWDVEQRGNNIVDGGAFFYDTYECKDKKFIAIGPIEPQFFSEFVDKAGLDKTVFTHQAQADKQQWSRLKALLQDHLRNKTRDEWCGVFAGSDACVAPVLNLDEAPQHPHNRARNTYQNIEDVVHPSPAPRFQRTPSSIRFTQHEPGQDTRAILTMLNYDSDRITQLFDAGVVA